MHTPDSSSKQDKAIRYNERAEEYAKSGKVEASARKAIEALDDDEEAIELQEAETKGRSHANRPRVAVELLKPKSVKPAR